jgi:hypothetical protein
MYLDQRETYLPIYSAIAIICSPVVQVIFPSVINYHGEKNVFLPDPGHGIAAIMDVCWAVVNASWN